MVHRVDARGFFNQVNFAAPIAVLRDPRFGRIIETRAGSNARQIQLGVGVQF